ERFADGWVGPQELEQAHQSAHLVTTRLQGLARRALEEARGKQRHFVKTAFAAAGLAQAAEMSASQNAQVYPYPWSTDCGGWRYDGMALSLEADAYASVFQGKSDLLRD